MPGAIDRSLVLVAEDDTDLLEELTEALRGRGFPTRPEASLMGALGAVSSSSSIQVIVTDIRLGSFNGLELVRRAYAAPRTRPLSSVVITGKPDLETAVTAMRYGVADYIVKPLLLDDLLNAVGRLLSAVDARRLVGPGTTDVLLVRKILKLLRQPSRIGSAPIGDTALIMLLDAYESWLSGAELSISSVSFGSGASTTTAFRRVRELCDRGLLARHEDFDDKRRVFIRITDSGRLEAEGILSVWRKHLGA